MSSSPLWSSPEQQAPDQYVAFRVRFTLDSAQPIRLRSVGSSWYALHVDGEYLHDGPARFALGHPEWLVSPLALDAGEHMIAVLATHTGVDTRMLPKMSPFLRLEVVDAEERDLPLEWRCLAMPGYEPQVRRICNQLGWVEWCDTRQQPEGWRLPGFDDTAWAAPCEVPGPEGDLAEANLRPPHSFVHTGEFVAQGRLAEVFGYPKDDVATRFFLRELDPVALPAGGVWRRYDLGRVRLMRPRFVIDAPAGSVIEFACCEQLMHGRVSPYIGWSLGLSGNMDHYVARGGPQEFFPLTPKGGRHVEVHVLAPPDSVRFVREEFVERCYFDEAEGRFACGDPLLERIWHVGVETLRACSEDALTDNPTRERGQWMGDVATVGLESASVAWRDLRLIRRGLVQAAQCARADGLVAAQCPGQLIYTTTYAAQWNTACLRYFELTGERALLDELFEPARRNQEAFEALLGDDGLQEGSEWIFIDWGYGRNPGPICAALNLHYLESLREMARWCELLGQVDEAARFGRRAERLEASIRCAFEQSMAEPGFHAIILALRLGLINEAHQEQAVELALQHIRQCFPLDPDSPRLGSPFEAQPRIITPYFMHYALPELIERGRMDDVLEIIRQCWGWGLEQGRSTWVEVFDTRWSHCHQWSGCPTWQLSRYLLGLGPRFDLGRDTFMLNLQTGSLGGASGRLPYAEEGVLDIEWTRQADGGVAWSLTPSRPVRIVDAHGKPLAEIDKPVTWGFDAAGTPCDGPESLRINAMRKAASANGTIMIGTGRNA